MQSIAQEFRIDKAGHYPISPPTDNEAREDFNALKALDWSELLRTGEWHSRSEFDAPQASWYIANNKVGLLASDRHHWSARMACDSVNSPSPIRSWYQSEIRKTLENSVYFEDNPKTALALRKYIASQFRPSAARALYGVFKAKTIYDPCGGWGDRLVAAQAGDHDYFARDTNQLVLAGYASQQLMYKTKAKIGWEYKGSEVDAPAHDFFDLSFTSPPYWKAEKYQGDKSSYHLFKSFDSWIQGFMIPTVNNCWNAVKVGGHVCFNVSDVYANHTVNRICQPIIDELRRLGGQPYVAGYQMAKRPNSTAHKTGVFCEPIIICTKTKPRSSNE